MTGPAWVQLRFKDVKRTSRGRCVAGAATIVGTYFYDALTNDAGVYSFYATAAGSDSQAAPVEAQP